MRHATLRAEDLTKVYDTGSVKVEALPNHLREALSRIPGVSAVETRIAGSVILDIEGLAEPASGRLVSLAPFGEPVLNALFLREGRLPDPRRDDEIAVNESFAKTHGFRPARRSPPS